VKRSRINPVSAKRAKLNPIRASFRKRILEERMACEARIRGCTMMPTDVHEIKTRARGGSIIDEHNVLALCRSCHVFITENPGWAVETGFVVHSWATEADMRAAQRARFKFTYNTNTAVILESDENEDYDF